jgi:hypothetical protein
MSNIRSGSGGFKSEYISAVDAAAKLGKSRVQFIYYLREHRKTLPLLIDKENYRGGWQNGIGDWDREEIYSEDSESVGELAALLDNFRINIIDWELHFENIDKSPQPPNGDSASLQKELEEKDARIATLETELAAAQVRIAELEAISHCDGKGALKVVCDMRRGEMLDKEIAKHLRGKGLSKSQIGALLHENPLNVTHEAITTFIKRMLK